MVGCVEFAFSFPRESCFEFLLCSKCLDSHLILQIRSIYQRITMTTPGANAGFAFVVNSLLSSNKNAKVLSKAKKESENKLGQEVEDKETPIEVIDGEGRVVQTAEEKAKASKSGKSPKKSVKLTKIAKFTLESVKRTKPKLDEREKERRLAAVATKGVVQLFNVVKDQQKNIKHKLEEVGKSTSKRAKVLSQFTEETMIKKANDNKKVRFRTREMQQVPCLYLNLPFLLQTSKHEPTAVEAKKWKVLSDDFMTGSKFKDWDKESDEDD